MDTTQVQEKTQNINTYLSEYAIEIIIGVVFLLVSFKLINKLSERLGNKLESQKIDKSFSGALSKVFVYTLKFIVLLVFAQIIGIPTSTIILLLGIIVIILIIGLQGSFSNLGSGLWLMALRPYGTGHYVEVNDIEGTVLEVHVYNTTIITPDKKVVTIPNALITEKNIINYDKRMTRRVDLNVHVDYSNDLEEVKKILLDAAKTDDRVLDDQKSFVVVNELRERSVHLQLRVFVKTIDFWKVKHQLPIQMKNMLSENGVEFPYKKGIIEAMPA